MKLAVIIDVSLKSLIFAFLIVQIALKELTLSNDINNTFTFKKIILVLANQLIIKTSSLRLNLILSTVFMLQLSYIIIN